MSTLKANANKQLSFPSPDSVIDQLSRSGPVDRELGFSVRNLAMALLIIGVLLILIFLGTQVRAEPLQFLSTQLTRFEEAYKMRTVILKDSSRKEITEESLRISK